MESNGYGPATTMRAPAPGPYDKPAELAGAPVEAVGFQVEAFAAKAEVPGSDEKPAEEAAAAHTEAAVDQAEAADAQTEAADAQAEAADAQTEAAAAQTESGGAEIEAAAAQTEAEGAQAEAADAPMESAGAQAEAADAQVETAAGQTEQADAQMETAVAQVEAADAQMEAAGAEAEAGKTQVVASEQPAGAAIVVSTRFNFDVPPEMERMTLVKKVHDLMRSAAESKAKWWSFCKTHAEGNDNLNAKDLAFLVTFFEAYEAGDVFDEDGNPYAQNSGGGWNNGWQAKGNHGGGNWGSSAQSAGGWASAGGAPDASSGKIFVGGLPRHATEDSVRVYFSKFGNISDLMLKYDPQLGTHKGFGFVTFQDPAVAQQVLNHKRGHWMDARWIDCKPSSPKGSGKGGKGGGGGGCGGGAWQQRKSGWASAGGAPDASSGKLFVGGLPRHATEDSVRVYFSKFGNISDLMLKYDPQLGTHKGFAFVTFQDPAVAQQVLNHKEGHWMDGRWIDCKPSSPKGSGKGAKGGGGGGRGRGAWQQGKSGGNSWGNDWQSSWQNKNQYSDQGGSKNSGWNSGGGGGGGGSWGNNTSGDQAQLAGNNGGGG